MQVSEGHQVAINRAIRARAAAQAFIPLVEVSGFELSTLVALERAFYLADERSIAAYWLKQQQLPSARQLLQRAFLSKPLTSRSVAGRSWRIDMDMPLASGRCVLRLRFVWSKRQSWVGFSMPVAKLLMYCYVENKTHECVFQQELHLDNASGLRVRKRQTRLSEKAPPLVQQTASQVPAYL